MKTLSVVLIASLIAFASCSKDKLPVADDAIVAASGSGSSKVEDNPTGGGGNNIAPASVPAVVKTAFSNRFPTATRVEWKLKNGQYKAEFFIGSVRWQAIYSAAGVLLKLERAS